MQIADAIGVVAAGFHQHGLAHDGCTGRRSGDDAATCMYFMHTLLDRGISDLAGDAQLIAACEENARCVAEYRQSARV